MMEIMDMAVVAPSLIMLVHPETITVRERRRPPKITAVMMILMTILSLLRKKRRNRKILLVMTTLLTILSQVNLSRRRQFPQIPLKMTHLVRQLPKRKNQKTHSKVLLRLQEQGMTLLLRPLLQRKSRRKSRGKKAEVSRLCRRPRRPNQSPIFSEMHKHPQIRSAVLKLLCKRLHPKLRFWYHKGKQLQEVVICHLSLRQQKSAPTFQTNLFTTITTTSIFSPRLRLRHPQNLVISPILLRNPRQMENRIIWGGL
mmetsp:Transcript_8606/g.12154  ORF Transcript_8606/g.12154 Transcript_8606/m.12154 type:complete len:256 (-) Transcript_8606:568-1335(-)